MVIPNNGKEMLKCKRDKKVQFIILASKNMLGWWIFFNLPADLAVESESSFLNLGHSF